MVVQDKLLQDKLLDAQAALLGAMLIDERTVGPALQEVTADDFVTPGYRTIFCAIQSIFGEGGHVDPVTVLARVPGLQQDVLVQLMDITPTAAHFQDYAAILRQEARLYRLREIAGRIVEAGDEAEARACVDEANALLVQRAGVKCWSLEDAYADFFRRHAGNPDYLPWGMDRLDKQIRARRGDMVILGGYPSAGKTALALALAHGMARTMRVGFYSYETDIDRLHDRYVAQMTGITLRRQQDNCLSDADWETMAEGVGPLTAPQLDLIEASGMTVADIRSHALARHYDVVYVDYLQKIRSSRGYRASEYEQVTQISSDLQAFGRQTGISVVALAQLSRQETGADGRAKPPTMASLRSSGQMEQDATVILLLWREDAAPGSDNQNRVLLLAKNKDGVAGRQMVLGFDGPTMRFWDRMQGPEPPPPEVGQSAPEEPAQQEYDFVDPFV